MKFFKSKNCYTHSIKINLRTLEVDWLWAFIFNLSENLETARNKRERTRKNFKNNNAPL